MEIKKVKFILLIFLGLLLMSLSFRALAEENSSSEKNIFLDSDQDGLSDKEEKTYGTDPQKADTDGDGYSDGAEIKSGYNPLKPAPGDKIVKEDASFSQSDFSGISETTENTTNITAIITQKIQNQLEEKAQEGDYQNATITSEELQNIIDQTLEENVKEEPLPEVSLEEIKIKKQNYNKLKDEEKKKKKKISSTTQRPFFTFSPATLPRPSLPAATFLPFS